jgi:hypothetical protein
MMSPFTSSMGVACRESWKDRTSRSWSFEAEFPLEAWVTAVGLLIDSAVGLLPNVETAQQERSMLLANEQNLLVKEEKEVCA